MSNNMSAFDEFDDEYDDDDVTETRRAEKKDKKVENFLVCCASPISIAPSF